MLAYPGLLASGPGGLLLASGGSNLAAFLCSLIFAVNSCSLFLSIVLCKCPDFKQLHQEGGEGVAGAAGFAPSGEKSGAEGTAFVHSITFYLLIPSICLRNQAWHRAQCEGNTVCVPDAQRL